MEKTCPWFSKISIDIHMFQRYMWCKVWTNFPPICTLAWSGIIILLQPEGLRGEMWVLSRVTFQIYWTSLGDTLMYWESRLTCNNTYNFACLDTKKINAFKPVFEICLSNLSALGNELSTQSLKYVANDLLAQAICIWSGLTVQQHYKHWYENHLIKLTFFTREHSMQMSTSNKIHNAWYELRVTFYLEVVYAILL